MLRTTRLACTLLTLAVLACCGGDTVTHHPSDSISQKPLFWEIHPSHQILEARVRTEIGEAGRLDIPIKALRVGAFEVNL